MNDIRHKIETISKTGYSFDFSTTFNHALETYKKIALPAGLVLLFYSLIMCALFMLYIFSSSDWQRMAEDLKTFDISQFSTAGVLMYIVAMMLFTALSIPLAAGIMQMCRKANLGESINFADGFQYYTGPYFSDLFFTGLLITTVSVAFATLLEYFKVPVIGTVISVVVGLLTVLAPAMVLFGHLRPLEAIRASFIVVGKEVLMIFLLIIIAYLISFAGMLALCIGVIFTLPFLYAMHYSIYYHSVGFEEDRTIDSDLI